jgi:hypothetical protein
MRNRRRVNLELIAVPYTTQEHHLLISAEIAKRQW